MQLTAIPLAKPEGTNIILGQAHFIKTVEDIYETLANAGGSLRFGVGFCEASGACLVRRSGNDAELTELAARHAEEIGAGHFFVVLLQDGYPLSILNALKLVPEVCTVYCATANPVEVLVAETEFGRAVIGVIDGLPPAGIEGDDDAETRRQLVRDLGYKL